MSRVAQITDQLTKVPAGSEEGIRLSGLLPNMNKQISDLKSKSTDWRSIAAEATKRYDESVGLASTDEQRELRDQMLEAQSNYAQAGGAANSIGAKESTGSRDETLIAFVKNAPPSAFVIGYEYAKYGNNHEVVSTAINAGPEIRQKIIKGRGAPVVYTLQTERYVAIKADKRDAILKGLWPKLSGDNDLRCPPHIPYQKQNDRDLLILLPRPAASSGHDSGIVHCTMEWLSLVFQVCFRDNINYYMVPNLMLASSSFCSNLKIMVDQERARAQNGEGDYTRFFSPPSVDTTPESALQMVKDVAQWLI